MSSTSQKHKNFVAEPMGDKPVTDLAGIGEVLGKRLEAAGFDKVLGYLGTFVHSFAHLSTFIRVANLLTVIFNIGIVKL